MDVHNWSYAQWNYWERNWLIILCDNLKFLFLKKIRCSEEIWQCAHIACVTWSMNTNPFCRTLIQLDKCVPLDVISHVLFIKSLVGMWVLLHYWKWTYIRSLAMYDNTDRRVLGMTFLSIRDQNAFSSCVQPVNGHTRPHVLNLLWLFLLNTDPHIVGTPIPKIISLLHHNLILMLLWIIM